MQKCNAKLFGKVTFPAEWQKHLMTARSIADCNSRGFSSSGWIMELDWLPSVKVLQLLPIQIEQKCAPHSLPGCLAFQKSYIQFAEMFDSCCWCCWDGRCLGMHLTSVLDAQGCQKRRFPWWQPFRQRSILGPICYLSKSAKQTMLNFHEHVRSWLIGKPFFEKLLTVYYVRVANDLAVNLSRRCWQILYRCHYLTWHSWQEKGRNMVTKLNQISLSFWYFDFENHTDKVEPRHHAQMLLALVSKKSKSRKLWSTEIELIKKVT